jgi:hypothetical protein
VVAAEASTHRRRCPSAVHRHHFPLLLLLLLLEIAAVAMTILLSFVLLYSANCYNNAIDVAAPLGGYKNSEVSRWPRTRKIWSQQL